MHLLKDNIIGQHLLNGRGGHAPERSNLIGQLLLNTQAEAKRSIIIDQHLWDARLNVPTLLVEIFWARSYKSTNITQNNKRARFTLLESLRSKLPKTKRCPTFIEHKIVVKCPSLSLSTLAPSRYWLNGTQEK